jgi:hypothetical protein
MRAKCSWMPIPTMAVTDSDLIPVNCSGLMPVTIGAKRRWRMDLDRSDRHPSNNLMRGSPTEFCGKRNRCCC